jgi:hypothetical protein
VAAPQFSETPSLSSHLAMRRWTLRPMITNTVKKFDLINCFLHLHWLDCVSSIPTYLHHVLTSPAYRTQDTMYEVLNHAALMKRSRSLQC